MNNNKVNERKEIKQNQHKLMVLVVQVIIADTHTADLTIFKRLQHNDNKQENL